MQILKTYFLKYSFIIFFFTTTILNAQLYFFGRNKVHYENFEWKVIKTEHFDIYYYDDFEEMAEIGAAYAEEAFDDLKIKFNHIMIKKIPLIFYNTHNHFQQTNTIPNFIPEGVGGFFEFMKGRVVIPYLTSLEQFRHVIRHELVHVFMTSKVLNVVKDHRVIGDNYPPLWFVEGIAEYWSYHWDTQAEMIMRDAVLNNFFAPLKDIYRIYGSFLMYKEGQNFLEFVSKKYGEDKILQFLENFWRFKNFEDVIEFTIGERFEKIDEDWQYYLKQKYYPLYENKTSHFIESKKITYEGYNFSPNYFESENGNKIFFVGNRNGYSSIYKMDYNPDSIDFAEPEQILEGEKEVIFETFHLLKPSMTISSKGILAFVTKAGATDAIHLFDTKNNEILKHFKFNELLTIESPSFDSSGIKILFHATDRKGYIDIYQIEINSGEIKRFTNDFYSDRDPIFNKDNSKIIFSSDRTSGIYQQKNNLFEIDINTGEVKYLTYSNADLTSPKYSPDYSSLYCLADNDGVKNLWQINFDKNNEPLNMTQKTRFLTSIFEYEFVDSNELITSTFEKFSFQFFSLNLDEIPDTILLTKNFTYDEIKIPWQPEKIVINSETDKLHYENQYSLDYAFSQISTDPIYGTRGGAIFSLSDLLGDDRYYFMIYNSAEIQSDFFKNINVAISRVNTGGRTNFGYGIFHHTGRRYDIRESDSYFYERSFGGYISLLYPLSSFQRIETSTTISNSDREISIDLLPRKALLLSNTISFIHDNTLWGNTGPVDGSRLRLLLGYTSDIKYSNSNFYSLIADYRNYFRLHNRITLATRASIFYNEGKDARRYIAGGSWDLRGWPRFRIRGEKMWLSSVELRYPLIDQFYLKLPFVGLGFAGIKGAAFIDAGSAWDDKYENTIGSVGIGLRFNFLGAITFRYDVGKKIENNFSSFQNSLFYQFFFGWDF
ncbi:MAG: PD40 domain-containing protein [Ignavibacteriae bacterium]|nr:PD40 domain-containing protein [Ignavibacteriota bacterium]